MWCSTKHLSSLATSQRSSVAGTLDWMPSETVLLIASHSSAKATSFDSCRVEKQEGGATTIASVSSISLREVTGGNGKTLAGRLGLFNRV